MLSLVSRYYHTLRFLQWTQIKYRLWYKLSPSSTTFQKLKTEILTKDLQLLESIPLRVFWLGNDSFDFLNIKHHFENGIDWNCSAYGKLWTYNLNYFEFLDQPGLSKHEGLGLIHDFINNINNSKDGLEPFPISLRVIFWIKFLIKHNIDDKLINESLYEQLQRLSLRPEYHLLGNHLLENGFSLLFGGVYFNDENLFAQANKILTIQLQEQILADGSHFELSPMYHQIMLYRVLDAINLLSQNSSEAYKELLLLFNEKAEIMLGWLQQMMLKSGDLPNLNDSISGVAPEPQALLEYASRLGIRPKQKILKDCGYRKFETTYYELFADVGSIGPDYIPGHAHSDTFSFVLHLHQSPFIVDTGISTYEKNQRRTLERSTSSHNTVMINNQEQSDVWGGFRVGRRAKVTKLEESSEKLMAIHNGYNHLGATHQRSFIVRKDSLVITDTITKEKNGMAFLHFHPMWKLNLSEIKILGDFGCIEFEGAESVHLEPYFLARGFNQTVASTKAVIQFKNLLLTKFTFNENTFSN
ncbi:MAG: heparinase II/III family protein [Saprospiraceae bacterium]